MPCKRRSVYWSHRGLAAGVLFLSITAWSVDLYWADAERGTIARSRSTVPEVEHIVLGLQVPSGIAADAGTNALFWAARSSGMVQQSLTDGLAVSSTAMALESPVGVEYDPMADVLYISSDRGIGRVSLEHGTIEDVILDLHKPAGIALDTASGLIFWAEHDAGKIRSAPTTGGPVMDIVIGLAGPSDVVIDATAGKLYWSDDVSGKIQSFTMATQMVADLAIGLDHPVGLALDAKGGFLYWRANNMVQCLQLPLPNPVENVVLDAGASAGLALAAGTIIDQAGGLWVDFNAEFPWYGTFEYPFERLTDALDVAESGRTIRVKPGATAEAPRIAQHVSIVAVGGVVRIGQLHSGEE